MSNLGYEDLAHQLLNEDKDVILVDTCILLDIVRLDSFDNYRNAKKIMNSLCSNTASFNSVIPSPVSLEWARHIDDLCKKAKEHVRNCYRNSNIILDILKCENSNLKFKIDDFQNEKIEDKLKEISSTILDKSYKCKVNKEIENRAFRRIATDKLPAKKGRASSNDCVIFEEVLEIATRLRIDSFGRKIIFVSSNTSDFGDGLHSGTEMYEELENLQIIYKVNLSCLSKELNI